MTKTKTALRDRLNLGPVICAEGYIFELERRGYIQAGAYVPTVVLDCPEVIMQLYEEFIRAGTDVLVALTYYAHRDKMKVIGREVAVEQLNRQAVRLAKRAAKNNDVLVAGNICNTWAYIPDDLKAAASVRRQYTEQVRWAVSEGVDFILAETLEYLGEALIAVEVIKSFHLEAVINFSAIYAQTKDGIDWITACEIVKQHGATVVGFNCARGPTTMLPLATALRRSIEGPISAVPVPYHTTKAQPAFQFLKRRQGNSSYTTGLDQHYIDRLEVAQFTEQAIQLGIEFIGLCCGAGPHHIRAMAEAIGRHPPASRFSADFSLHGLLGSEAIVPEHEKQFLNQW
ncbi:MAG: hypothetical protein NVS1B7_4470 [Candidatus Saccharimonadales bacterium]